MADWLHTHTHLVQYIHLRGSDSLPEISIKFKGVQILEHCSVAELVLFLKGETSDSITQLTYTLTL